MKATGLRMQVLRESFAVCQLERDEPIPAWAEATDFLCIVRTQDELSIISVDSGIPPNVRSERGWRALRVVSDLDFSMSGVLASLLSPLADAGIGVLVVSTYKTDYVMVKDNSMVRAGEILSEHDHVVEGN